MGIVININDFIKFGSLKNELSAAETQLLAESEILINSSLHLEKGIIGESITRCCDLNTESKCKNPLEIIITDIPNELRWSCSMCGSEGVIQNWRKSPVYRKYIKNRVKEEKPSGTLLKISKEKFILLKDISSSKGDLFIIFSSALENDSEYQMHISEFDVLRILELIALKIRKSPDKKAEMLSLKKEIVDSFYSSKTPLK